MTELNKLIATLKKDGSNPNINKEYLLKILGALSLTVEALSESSKVWELNTFIDEDISEVDVTGMKAGDIIVDNAYVFVGIINGVTLDNDGHITSLQTIGLNDAPWVVNAIYDGDTWYITELERGTKLYNHYVIFDMAGIGDDYFSFISTSNTPLTATMSVSEIIAELEKAISLKNFVFGTFGDSARWLSYIENPNTIIFIGLSDSERIVGEDDGNVVSFPNQYLVDTVTPL